MKPVKIYKKELIAIREAQGYIGNILESCTGSIAINRMNKTLAGLFDLEQRYYESQNNKPVKSKADESKCAHLFKISRGKFRCEKCKLTFGQWFIAKQKK